MTADRDPVEFIEKATGVALEPWQRALMRQAYNVDEDGNWTVNPVRLLLRPRRERWLPQEVWDRVLTLETTATTTAPPPPFPAGPETQENA